MSFSLMHNHATRDIRPHDCPRCRFQEIVSENIQLSESFSDMNIGLLRVKAENKALESKLSQSVEREGKLKNTLLKAFDLIETAESENPNLPCQYSDFLYTEKMVRYRKEIIEQKESK